MTLVKCWMEERFEINKPLVKALVQNVNHLTEGSRRLTEDCVAGDLIPTNGHEQKCRKKLSFNTASAGPAVNYKTPGETNKS